MRSSLVFVLALLVAGCEGPPGAAGKIVTRSVDDDTYVAEGEAGVFHVDEQVLEVGRTPQTHSYMKFELNGLNDVLAARIFFTALATSGAQVSITALAVEDDAWDAEFMTFGNKPLTGVALGVIQVSSDHRYDLDLTSYVVAQLTEAVPVGEVASASIALVVTSGATGEVVLRSSEDEDNEGPELAILPF